MQSKNKKFKVTNNSTSNKMNWLKLDEPVIMGILNVTPDSFFDGGKYKDEADIIHQTQQMISDGALIIDIGAYSSRPNAKHISVKDEENRLLPILKLIRTEYPTVLISIDTFRSSIAEKSLKHGANMINDISGGSIDKKMFDVIADYHVPYILMHMKGTPQNMQKLTGYKDILKEIKDYFKTKIDILQNRGVKNIMIDPGFGFGKTLSQNYELLQHLDEFLIFEKPILVGISRKSMINQVLGTTPHEALNGTTVLNTIALQKGAKILRVHDVKAAKEVILISEQIKKCR